MNREQISRSIGLFLVACWLPIFVGCFGTSPQDRIAAANDTNIKRIATLYSFYHLKHNFKGPKDEGEFKKFISQQDPSRMQLANIDVDDVDALFISERDDYPLKIRYGINTRVRGPSMPVVFEEQGVDGKRQVGFTNGSMQEVESDEYEQLLSGELDSKKPIELRAE